MLTINRPNFAGTYIGIRPQMRLEMRADVGEGNSLDIVSGDLYFETAPNQFEFHHSFQTTTLVLEDRIDGQMIRGPVKVHHEDVFDIARLDVFIPESGDVTATYEFYRLTSFGRQRAATLTFTMTRQTAFFRTVDLEIDNVQGVPLPRPFHPDHHPETPVDVPGQPITLQSAYRAAGIDLRISTDTQEVPIDLAGFDSRWTDEELHAAMVANFSQHQDNPQWRLYLLLATRYVSSGVLGIMFDSNDDSPRQGAAVFHDHPAIGNAIGVEKDREYLFTIVHELGHAFNFLHSFQKGIFETDGVLPRPSALSWMNYPQLYPFGFAGPEGWDGSDNFWSEFRFLFDEEEIRHLRHDDRAEVIMGGRSFGFAGHLEERPFMNASLDPDLTLQLWTPGVVEFLQQVEGDIKLHNKSGVPIEIPASLHPSTGSTTLLIRRPTDRYPKVYRHFSRACAVATPFALASGEAQYQELTPSFGQRHWFIDEPGTYELQAIVTMPNGRRLASPVRKTRVLNPDPEADRAASDFFTCSTGHYLGVEGSRSGAFDKTRSMLDDICDRLSKNLIARQITTTNAIRETRVFKDVRNGRIEKPDRTKATRDLLKTFGISAKNNVAKVDESFSHLRVSRFLESAAYGCATDGNSKEAKRVLDLVNYFLKSVKAPPKAITKLKKIAKAL